jgi:chloramphenicol 3-O-phosphotransferase
VKLIFLHGAPASGKLTVAKALLELLPVRLHDNHAAIDFARTVFDFGAPGFWDLVYKVREDALRAAIEHDVPFLVMTMCYSEPEDRRFFEQLEDAVVGSGGCLLPVFLHCSDEDAARRVGNADRVARRKTASVSGLASFLAQYAVCKVPRQNCLSIDTGLVTPDKAAAEIVGNFALGEQV